MAAQVLVLFVVFLCVNQPYGARSQDAAAVKAAVGLTMDVFGVKQSIYDGVKQMQDGRKELIDSMTSASQSVAGTYNVLMDKVDDDALSRIFDRYLPDPDKAIKNTACLEGISATAVGTGILIMKSGNLTNPKVITLLPKVTNAFRGRGDKVQATLSVIFSDLLLDYLWGYKTFSIMGKDREGWLRLLQTGPNYVNIVALLPRSRDAVRNLMHAKKCFLNVESVGVELGSQLNSLGIDYESTLKNTFGFGYTESIVKQIIKDIQPNIQVHVENTLKMVVGEAIEETGIFCKSDLTIPPTIDCHSIRDIGQYSKP